MSSSKRNYIRRKKAYNDSLKLLHHALEFISSAGDKNMTQEEINIQSKQHTDSVEAVCWDPRHKFTDEIYQKLMNTKTRELCATLISKNLPQLGACQLLQKMKTFKPFVTSLNDPNDNIDENNNKSSSAPAILTTPKKSTEDFEGMLLSATKSPQLFTANSSPTVPKLLPIPQIQRPVSAPPFAALQQFNDGYHINNNNLINLSLISLSSTNAVIEPDVLFSTETQMEPLDLLKNVDNELFSLDSVSYSLAHSVDSISLFPKAFDF